jgi:hypothetical protein
MAVVLDRNIDPIHLSAPSASGKTLLRIGSPEGRGKSRYAVLTPRELRLLGLELQAAAERAEMAVEKAAKEKEESTRRMQEFLARFKTPAVVQIAS